MEVMFLEIKQDAIGGRSLTWGVLVFRGNVHINEKPNAITHLMFTQGSGNNFVAHNIGDGPETKVKTLTNVSSGFGVTTTMVSSST